MSLENIAQNESNTSENTELGNSLLTGSTVNLVHCGY
jgi:hypothetical protein